MVHASAFPGGRLFVARETENHSITLSHEKQTILKRLRRALGAILRFENVFPALAELKNRFGEGYGPSERRQLRLSIVPDLNFGFIKAGIVNATFHQPRKNKLLPFTFRCYYIFFR